MFKKMRISIALLIAAAVAMLGGCKSPCGGFFTAEERMTHVIDKIETELSLDAAQKEALQTMVAEIKTKISGMAGDRKTIHRNLAAMVRNEQITVGELEETMAPHRQKWEETSALIKERFVRFHALLTPEQRDKLASIIETRMEKCSKNALLKN